MRIGLDFDRVLFDTDSFNKHLKENVDGLEHVEASPYNENEVYSPEIHADLCGIPVERIYSAIEDTSQFLFEDVDVLEDFEDELVIVSRGQKNFQRAKIENSGIDELVEEVHVVESGSKDQVDIDVLVDDTVTEIERLDIPGILFKREEDSLKDVLDKVKDFEA